MNSNPHLLDRPAVVSFSGGRTSGYMLRRILDAFGGSLPDDVKVIFCNTGKERPETLDFVERCSLEWGVPVTWLEFRYWPEEPPPAPGRLATRTRQTNRWLGLDVVNYATASRNGEPFDQLISVRHQLPNPTMRYCTQWLKIKTSWRYACKVLGWDHYTNAIGLRADEPRRVARLKADPKGTNGEEPFAPLAKAGVTLADVEVFWATQPFDLQLKPHEGNCDLCFLKSPGKRMRIMRERPDLADWWIAHERRMEGQTEERSASRFCKNLPGYEALLELSTQPDLFDGFPIDGDVPDCRCTD